MQFHTKKFALPMNLLVQRLKGEKEWIFQIRISDKVV